MLVFHLLPSDLARGAQRYARLLREESDGAEQRHRIVTLFRSEDAGLGADVELGVPAGLARRAGFDPHAFWRLRVLLRAEHPDVVIAHGSEPLKYAAGACPRATPIVYYKIGIGADGLRNPLRRALYRACLARAAVIAGVSNAVLEDVRTVAPGESSKLRLVPNGRDPAGFEPRDGAARSGPVRLGFVGHLTATKRPDLFVRLVRALRAEGLDVEGLVVGDGPLLDTVRLAATGEPVDVVGRRGDVPELLAACDLLVFTSVHEGEGMPGVLIEAGFAGIPVVTTDVPGARDVVEDGRTGLVAASDDFVGLVGATRRLVGDSDLRVEMGREARERCVERFTIAGSARRWAEVLDELGAPGSRRT